jgi:hypothetical protein
MNQQVHADRFAHHVRRCSEVMRRRNRCRKFARLNLWELQVINHPERPGPWISRELPFVPQNNLSRRPPVSQLAADLSRLSTFESRSTATASADGLR